MNEGLDALDRVVDRAALLDGKPRLVQLRDLPQRGRDDRARRRAGGARLAELHFELAGAPGEGGIDQAVERKRRGVSDHGHHVFDLDARLAAREQRELANLMARREPIAAEQRNEGGTRLW